MDLYLAEQYLAKIGYSSGSEKQIQGPEIESSCPILEGSPGHKTPSSLLPPPCPNSTEFLTVLYDELERRQHVCLGIESQINACQKQIRSLPSKQKKIKQKHEKPITDFENSMHEEKANLVDAGRRKTTQTAEEAEIEEMKDIYRHFDRHPVGVPFADSVDAFFGIIANTERHILKAEEAKSAAERRNVRLEEKLYRAICAVLEMKDEIERLDDGLWENELGGSEVENSRTEVQDRSRRKPKRRKRGTDKHEGKEGHVGDRRSRRRRRNVPRNA